MPGFHADACSHLCRESLDLLGRFGPEAARSAPPLVDNDPAERHASPLGVDPRPMDGIVHASFVLARMVWCVDRLLESGLLPVAERDAMARRSAMNLRRFQDSQALIERAARFTETGGPLWFAARDWAAVGCPA